MNNVYTSVAFYMLEFLTTRPYADLSENAHVFEWWFNHDIEKTEKRAWIGTTILDYTTSERENHMAMAKKRKSDFGVEFINYKPKEDEKEAIKDIAEDFDLYTDTLQVLDDDNLKISLSYDDHLGCFGAFLTAKDPDSVNKGLCASSKHTNPIVAMVCVLYFHRVVSEGVWGVQKANEDVDW